MDHIKAEVESCGVTGTGRVGKMCDASVRLEIVVTAERGVDLYRLIGVASEVVTLLGAKHASAKGNR